MENITKALYQAAGLLIFIAAVTLLFMCVKSTDEMSEAVTAPKSYKYEYSESTDFSYVKDAGGESFE